MSDVENDGLPSKMTNSNIVKYLKEQKIKEDAQRNKDELRNIEMQQMRDELKRLREEIAKAKDSKEFDEESDEESPLEEEEKIPPDQRLLVTTLKSMEKRTMDAKLDLPTYDGRMNPDAALDWVDALNSFFECDEIIEN